MNYTIKISDLLSNISEIFVGEYNHRDKELNELRNEILNIDIVPGSDSDKHILKEDFNNFLKDTRKAEKKIKEELLNG